ncbi:copper resistance system multicopper oxidase [Sphingomicrobium flavum]|uniref:copper resistance system multicopper oxidase n=1 Tax=Sphingomicrobium flavum TaxID=1229164 RepID=UPI0021ADC079|nr:copper resistance system multicopper oxidase [Sphingomicrobium flavum]
MNLTRRHFLWSGSLGLAGLATLPAWAKSGTSGVLRGNRELSGEHLHLTIDHGHFMTGGKSGHAITINGSLPGPMIRLKEGQKLKVHVDNRLDEDTSIHWHGLILPFDQDGVPGVSFPGIPARGSFTYEFPIVQSGTYWYHSHSGLQEQQGHYGALIIDPAGEDPIRYDREHVIVLSDWTFEHPHKLMAKLKQQPAYFNRQKPTMTDGKPARPDFAAMRMDPADISDINGSTYTFLMNGHGPAENWTGLFNPGERVRLRIVNASAMSIFNLRIPGLAMEVVQADGMNVKPVETDELQISVAETYDVVVTPTTDEAFTIVAEAIDRSGMARGTLAPRMGMTAAVPALRERPTLTMKDMGMGAMAGMDHGGMDHSMRDASLVPFDPGVGVDMISPMPIDRTGDRPLGLEDAPHRVLTYHDLAPLTPFADTRAPQRTIEVHLTGNMERFMWSMDGEKLSENPEPIRLERDERVRFKLINHSMMNHPIHIHGHFFELVTGMAHGHPIKHTVNVMPGGIARFDMTADAPGDWAFHCHLLYHMHAGMMRVVTVRPMDDA